MFKSKSINQNNNKTFSEDIPNNLTSKKINKNKILSLHNNNKFYFKINNIRMDYCIDENDYNRKKKLLNTNEQKNQKLYFPYVMPDKNGPGKDVYFYKLINLSLDYDKYLHYLNHNVEYLEFLFTSYSYYLENIIFALSKENVLFQIYNHVKAGFTFTILHILKIGKNIQPCFYFNYNQFYSLVNDLKTKKEMIFNEFVRIIDDFQTFNKIINIFNQKIENNQIWLKENFFHLLEIIKECLKFLHNNVSNYKKYQKIGIIIDDFVLNAYVEENYNNFILKLKSIKELQVFYVIKFLFLINNKYEPTSLRYFSDSTSQPIFYNNAYYFLTEEDLIYLPRNLEQGEVNCFPGFEKIQGIINNLGNNYCDLIRFKGDIDLYIKGIIDYKELEEIIINTYRCEYSNVFKYSNTFYNYIKNPIKDSVDYFNYNEKYAYLGNFLLLPYIDINFSEKKIHIMGPIYKKIINKIIDEQKIYDDILYNFNNNIKFGISFEGYLKSAFQYQSFELYKENYNKYFLFCQEIKRPSTINWSYIFLKSSLCNNNHNKNLFVIDQSNTNGQYFDYLFIKTIKINNKIICKLFFTQISVKKTIEKLIEILDNMFLIIDDYKTIMSKNNLEFSQAYFYLISSEKKIYKELFNYCFKLNIYINITFQENEKCFYYYGNNSYDFADIIKELPIKQDYKTIISNYLMFEIFDKIPKTVSFTNKQLINFSKFHNKIDKFHFQFNSDFIIKNYGENINIKFLLELDYNKKYMLKKNILGITINENENENKKEITTNNVSLLGKKIVKIKPKIKKQIYWINNTLVNEKLDIVNYSGKFCIFKITQKKRK